MNEAPRLNVVELTVSELSAQLKKTVEEAFGYVRVRGEVSGFKGPSPSGHVYFRLKDERAVLEAVIWKGVFGRMRVKPEEGLEVVVSGKLTTFAGSSKYQIVIESLEPAGLGALMALVEERKKKLAAEGLFDPARKQLLPFLPDVIGVVTSPTGAVIRDILHRLADRFPREVLVWPVKVQGEGSAEEVAAAIRGFNALPEGGKIPRPDVLIVARGGGSLEDLWSFNEEIVVRAAADSMIPLISAVGHETDVTLIDFAADKRAPTPTAAAEMAVPVRAELLSRVDSLARRNVSSWLRGHEARRTELRAAVRALPTKEDLLALPRQRLDVASERLPLALKANAQLHHARFSRASARLRPAALQTQLATEKSRLRIAGERGANAFNVLHVRRRDRFRAVALRLAAGVRANAQTHAVALQHSRTRVSALMERAHRAIDVALNRRFARLDAAGQLLSALSYRSVLERGYALIRDSEGRPLRNAASVSAGMALDIEFSDGRVGAVAGETRSVTPAPDPARSRGRSGGKAPGQGNLFD